jgi:hypothetical protein
MKKTALSDSVNGILRQWKQNAAQFCLGQIDYAAYVEHTLSALQDIQKSLDSGRDSTHWGFKQLTRKNCLTYSNCIKRVLDSTKNENLDADSANKRLLTASVFTADFGGAYSQFKNVMSLVTGNLYAFVAVDLANTPELVRQYGECAPIEFDVAVNRIERQLGLTDTVLVFNPL